MATDTRFYKAPATTARIPLGLKGAYTAPRPPDHFDFHRASDRELDLYGFSWVTQHPNGRALLHRLTSNRNLTWIRPELAVDRRKSHPSPRRPIANDPVTTNWAGGVLFANGLSPIPVPGRQIDAYSTEFNDQQHVNFIRADGHVCEMVYNGGWSLNDLTQLAGAPPAVVDGPIDGYVTPLDQQQHVNFLGTDGHIHELFYDGGGWRHNDLTGSGKIPNANPDTGLTGYATADNQQHVIFIGPNNHLFELLFNGAWSTNDLTALAGAFDFPAANGSSLDGYTTIFNGQQHVNYVGFDNHLHELFYDGNWQHNDLTQLAGAPDATAGAPITAYSTEYNQQQHVFFLGTDAGVHELLFDGNWQHNNLTQLANSPAPRLDAGFHAYATDYNGQQHVNFVGTDDSIHELFFDGAWQHNNLTISSGSTAVLARTGSALAGYSTEYNDQQHVIFIDSSNHIEELFYGTQWTVNDLTNATLSGVVPDAWIFAMGIWNVPTVSQPDLPSGPGGGWTSSSWVGIDGADSNDVLQAGIEQHFDGVDSYVAWYEWYAPTQDGSPDYVQQTNISNFPVAAGDSILCIVRYTDSQTKGGLFLANLTTASFFTIQLDPPPGATFSGNCIEWIVETPSYYDGLSALPAFSEVVFTDALGLNINNGGGNAADSTIFEIVKNDTTLTSTTVADQRVTIDYLPWHALNIGAESGAPPPDAASALDAYAADYNQQLHVNYLTTSGHVIELLFDGSWNVNDLTLACGAPNAAAGSTLDGFVTEFNQQQHIHFIGADQHVHELFYDGAWQHNDLHFLSSSPVTAAPSSPLSGYVTDFNGQQHVNFIGTDNHVHELYFDGNWHHNDLTQLAAGPDATSGSALDSYATDYNEQQHVNYLDADGHVHELYYDGAWMHNDLSALTGAPAAASNAPLAGYTSVFNQQQHVNFVGADNRVYELVYDSGWRFTDLLAGAGVSTLLASNTGALDGYASEFNSQLHVHFLGTDGHLHELWYSDQWRHNELTSLSGSPPPGTSSPIAGFTSSFNEQQHVIYLTAALQVMELMF